MVAKQTLEEEFSNFKIESIVRVCKQYLIEKQIESNKNKPELPILMLTGYFEICAIHTMQEYKNNNKIDKLYNKAYSYLSKNGFLGA